MPIAVASPLTTYTNSTPIAIPDAGSAPTSTIPVAMAPTSVTDVNVTLNQITHDFAEDIDVLLVGPTGKTVVLMSDVTGGQMVTLVDITLDDAATTSLPDESDVTTGTYKPSNYFSATAGCPNEEPDPFAGAPAGPYGSALSDFNGTNPNGNWSLYVVDDCMLFAPVNCICQGWSLILNEGPTGVGVAELGAVRRGVGVTLRWRTRSETNLSGFNVYRSSGTRSAKLNRKLIAARSSGRAAGARYTLVDPRAQRGGSSTYRLETVDLSGRRTSAGSVTVASR